MLLRVESVNELFGQTMDGVVRKAGQITDEFKLTEVKTVFAQPPALLVTVKLILVVGVITMLVPVNTPRLGLDVQL